MKKSVFSTRMLATAAICIAMSYLLSMIKLYQMPMGGSVTVVSMLPLMIFSWVYGVWPGILAGTVYGLLQIIQEPVLVHFVQVILDYPLAFAVLGLAGALRRYEKSWAFLVGVFIACFGRFVCHLVSGMVFFSSILTTADFWDAFVYSALYNGGFLGVEMVMTMIVAALPPVQHMIRRIGAIVSLSHA